SAVPSGPHQLRVPRIVRRESVNTKYSARRPICRELGESPPGGDPGQPQDVAFSRRLASRGDGVRSQPGRVSRQPVSSQRATPPPGWTWCPRGARGRASAPHTGAGDRRCSTLTGLTPAENAVNGEGRGMATLWLRFRYRLWRTPELLDPDVLLRGPAFGVVFHRWLPRGAEDAIQ